MKKQKTRGECIELLTQYFYENDVQTSHYNRSTKDWERPKFISSFNHPPHRHEACQVIKLLEKNGGVNFKVVS